MTFNMEKITIGRAADNDIIFKEPKISNRHATINLMGNSVQITDHSTNGTYINGKKLHNNSCFISKDDIILLPGDTRLYWDMIVKKDSGRKTVLHNEFEEKEFEYDNNIKVLPSLSFGQAIGNAFSHYADFSGRARRSEYWWFAFFGAVLSVIPYLGIISSLVLAIPSLSVAVRRLHDINKSGWYLLLALIPIVGGILLIVWYCQDSYPNKNEYGLNPKQV